MNLTSSLSGEYAVVAFPCFSDEEMGVQGGGALSRASQFPALTLSLPGIRFTLSPYAGFPLGRIHCSVRRNQTLANEPV